MKRPMFVVTIGYLIGIIMGLYLKISIALLYALIIPILIIIKFIKLYLRKKYLKKNKKENKFNMFYVPRYFRYLKLIFNSKILILIIIASFISNSIIIYKNTQYDELYKDIDKIELIGIVVDIRDNNNTNNTYKDIYTIKIISVNGNSKFKDTNLLLNVNKNKKIKLNIGNKVYIEGEYKGANISRNYGGFDYKEYLKQINIFGTVNLNSAKILEECAISKIELNLYNFRVSIKDNVRKLLDKDVNPIFLGLIMGDTSSIDNDTKESFKISNISHILAVSGMHISIIILGCSIVLNKILGKKKSKIITIFLILFYILITGFSPSIIRAGLTSILILIGGILHRKNDIWTSLSISLLMTLMYNPYLIGNIGLQFSYIGTIGIVLLNKNISKIFNNKKQKTQYNSRFDRVKNKTRELLSVCISVQIFILPISIFHFNTVGIYFILTNLLLSFIITPTVIISFVFLMISILNLGFLAKIIGFLVNIMFKIILLISNFSFLPFSKIYIRTPKISQIIIFYMIVIIINLIYSVKIKKNINGTELRVKYIIEVLKYKFRKNKKRIMTIPVLAIMTIGIFKFIIIKRDLNVHFVDVGQGDCCFIETPQKKTILIDGGGSENYDVGKRVLVPYILDRGYTRIDYVIISHFDTDHVGGVLTVMRELDVGTVLISKQCEESENYIKFKEIVKQKKINVKIVAKGDDIEIEKDLHFYILWPNKENQIKENALNNNSIVCKMKYKNFSCVFTGDIENVAEKEILKEYNDDLKILNATVLKVGHHGSKTSSSKEFLKSIKPQIALIGVGESNKFGHPNDEVLERLENLGSKVYRTDKMGEIDLIIDYKSRIKIKQFIQR